MKRGVKPRPSIVFGSDHAGLELKNHLMAVLKTTNDDRNLSGDITDVGCYSSKSCDYPDFAHQAMKKLEQGFDIAVLVCGTGQGMCMTANTYPRARAGVAWSPAIAEAIRSHNDANVLCLPARHLSHEEATKVLLTFLNTEASPEERHRLRVKKIKNDYIRITEIYKDIIGQIQGASANAIASSAISATGTASQLNQSSPVNPVGAECEEQRIERKNERNQRKRERRSEQAPLGWSRIQKILPDSNE